MEKWKTNDGPRPALTLRARESTRSAAVRRFDTFRSRTAMSREQIADGVRGFPMSIASDPNKNADEPRKTNARDATFT